HTRFSRDWSSDVCSSDLGDVGVPATEGADPRRVLRVAVLEVVAEVGPVLPNRDVVRDGAAVVRRLLDGDEFRAALLLLVVHPGAGPVAHAGDVHPGDGALGRAGEPAGGGG